MYENNFSFSKINKLYKSYFGTPIPFKEIIDKKTEETVFNEKLSYNSKTKYYDGVKLNVSNNYLVPVIKSGMVVYIGNKENMEILLLFNK